MLHFDTAQMAAITQAHFFSRVAEFVRDQTSVDAYRRAALDTTIFPGSVAIPATTGLV